MKKGRLLIICFMLFITLIFSGCAAEKITETPVLELSKTTIVETEATVTLVPTPSPTPTKTAPIPCTISFETDRDGNQEIYSMAPDGSRMNNLTNNPAYDVEPAWSPDGNQIAFVSNRANKEQEGGNYIYIMNADGSNVRQLTYENDSADPDWSHDGSQITYSNKGDIFIIKSDGKSKSVNLTKSPEQDEQPTWSPDGSQIAWLTMNGDKGNIFVMNADGSHILQLTENGKVYDVLWTIDGEIFSHWEHPDGVCFNCVMNADGTNTRDGGGKGELNRLIPFKTLDGNRVECVSGDINSGNEEIYLVSEIYPDIFLNLTNNPGMDRNPDWPANCLEGFEGITPEEPAVSVTETNNSQLIIGYAGDEPSQWQRKNNFSKACAELSIQCVFGEIPDLLNQNVNAIVLNSNPEMIRGSAVAIREVVEKGIPVFVLDAEIEMDGAYSIVADRGDLIRATLNNLFKNSDKSGEFAYFDFSSNQMDAELIKGLLEKEYPKIKVVTSDANMYNIKAEKYYMEALLSEYPNLKAIWTNAGYTNAIFGIVENISNPARYPMLNCEANKDGFFIWKDRLVEYPGFECTAVSNPPGIAYDAVFAAFYLVNGEKIDESALKGEFGNAFLVDFPVITNENLLKELEIINYENGDFAVDMLMTPAEIKDMWFQ